MEAIIYASNHVTRNKMRKLALDCRTFLFKQGPWW